MTPEETCVPNCCCSRDVTAGEGGPSSIQCTRDITPSYRPKLLCLLDRPPARATTAKKVDEKIIIPLCRRYRLARKGFIEPRMPLQAHEPGRCARPSALLRLQSASILQLMQSMELTPLAHRSFDEAAAVPGGALEEDGQMLVAIPRNSARSTAGTHM